MCVSNIILMSTSGGRRESVIRPQSSRGKHISSIAGMHFRLNVGIYYIIPNSSIASFVSGSSSFYVNVTSPNVRHVTCSPIIVLPSVLCYFKTIVEVAK